jgi:hypothetical protein
MPHVPCPRTGIASPDGNFIVRRVVGDMLSLLLLSLPVGDDLDLLGGGQREQRVVFHDHKYTLDLLV